MTEEQIRIQSENAYKQWCTQWRKHATDHKNFVKKPLTDFEHTGIGKAIVVVANGYSFEEQIDIIKKYQNNVDIMCCDKTLGHLLDHGIKPTFCLVCDANVDYEAYMEKWKDQLDETTLLINVCANPRWSHNGNWKDIYFFVNKDIIHSEREFSGLSGSTDFITAGTNVSNAMIVMLTQCEGTLRRNFFGYDKIILVGFDYSWRHGGKYYAFNETGDGKSNYMCHQYVQFPSGECGYTSGNLYFSKEWLNTYIQTYKLPVVQCSEHSILYLGSPGNLEYQMQYRSKSEDSGIIKNYAHQLRKLEENMFRIRQKITDIGRDHYWSYVQSI